MSDGGSPAAGCPRDVGSGMGSFSRSLTPLKSRGPLGDLICKTSRWREVEGGGSVAVARGDSGQGVLVHGRVACRVHCTGGQPPTANRWQHNVRGGGNNIPHTREHSCTRQCSGQGASPRRLPPACVSLITHVPV